MFSSYYVQLLVVYIVIVGGSGVIGGLYADEKRKAMEAERRRLEFITRRYNRLTHDNYDPFEEL